MSLNQAINTINNIKNPIKKRKKPNLNPCTIDIKLKRKLDKLKDVRKGQGDGLTIRKGR